VRSPSLRVPIRSRRCFQARILAVQRVFQEPPSILGRGLCWCGVGARLLPRSPPSGLGASRRGVSCPTSLSQWSTQPVPAAAERRQQPEGKQAAVARLVATGAVAAVAAQGRTPVPSSSGRTKGWGRCQPL
jgi:hypothetical protein